MPDAANTGTAAATSTAAAADAAKTAADAGAAQAKTTAADTGGAKTTAEVAKTADVAKTTETVKTAEQANAAEQTEEQKAAADKAQGGAKRGPDGKFLPEPLIPADWKPKAPDGVKLDEGLLGNFRAIMADPKLSPADRAQKLVDLQIQANAATERAFAETLQRQRHADLEALKGDPEYGGAKFDQTRAQVRSILEKTKYGPAVSKKLEAVGLDCDPDFTRFLAEVRSVIAEDSTSSRLFSPAPVVNGAPKSQTERQAATYKQQPGKQ